MLLCFQDMCVIDDSFVDRATPEKSLNHGRGTSDAAIQMANSILYLDKDRKMVVLIVSLLLCV